MVTLNLDLRMSRKFAFITHAYGNRFLWLTLCRLAVDLLAVPQRSVNTHSIPHNALNRGYGTTGVQAKMEPQEPGRIRAPILQMFSLNFAIGLMDISIDFKIPERDCIRMSFTRLFENAYKLAKGSELYPTWRSTCLKR